MNDESVDRENPKVATDVIGSPGIAIRDARKSMGMSIEELATQTRLSKATLESLEKDEFEKLLEPVYVRGYYRKCAGILEVEEKPLIAAYDALYTPPSRPPTPQLRLASGGDLGSSPRVSGRLVIIGPVVAIIVAIAFWMSRQPSSLVSGPQTVTLLESGLQGSIEPSNTMPPLDDAATGVPSTPSSSSETFPAQARAGSPQSASGNAQADPTAAGSPSISTPEESAAARSAVAASEIAPEPAKPIPPPTGTKLKLRFDAISWTRIEDASGALLLSGIIPAGESRELDGQPPYSVFLGNGPGVKIEFQGKTIDVKPFVKNNSTARFSVPAAGG